MLATGFNHPSFASRLLIALTVMAAVIFFCVPRFTDPPAYYNFADHRTIFGIPRFMDVVSNLPFAVIGIIGLLSVLRPGQSSLLNAWERYAFLTLFSGILLIAAGSAWFHLAPSSATLLWDRLPMTLVFMSFFTIVLGDRIHPRAGRTLFVPLLAAGIISVLYWRYSELAGAGDLRFYALVQFFPMLALPVLLLLPARRLRQRDLAFVVGLYALAKLFEISDTTVFALTSSISGHTLKHLACAAAAASMLPMPGLPHQSEPHSPASHQRRIMPLVESGRS